MKIAVLGVTGYTGRLLLRLLAGHPAAPTILPVSASRAGTDIGEADPGFPEIRRNRLAGEGRLASHDEARRAGCDAVFSALPHGAAAARLEPFLDRSVVIDLSADFRLKDPAVYEATYGQPHPSPERLAGAVYGLAEWHRDALADADLIAQPGCYPTCTMLPLLPLLEAGLIEPGGLVVNALSGVSGAGRKAEIDYLFVERAEAMKAYRPGTSHRHVPEMRQELTAAAAGADLLFTPHLVPLRRGMAVTTVARLAGGRDASEIPGLYDARYGDTPFLRRSAGPPPDSGDVRGSNRCDITWRQEGDRLMLFSVLDNLYKGAAGNAVQCLNIRFGLGETAGLPLAGEV